MHFVDRKVNEDEHFTWWINASVPTHTTSCVWIMPKYSNSCKKIQSLCMYACITIIWIFPVLSFAIPYYQDMSVVDKHSREPDYNTTELLVCYLKLNKKWNIWCFIILNKTKKWLLVRSFNFLKGHPYFFRSVLLHKGYKNPNFQELIGTVNVLCTE